MIIIRIDISATVKGANLFGDLNIEFVDAVKRLLDIQNYYQVTTFHRPFECYLTRTNHPDARPIDPLAYVDDRLEVIKAWMQNGKYSDLFRIDRLIIDIDENRFQYRTQYARIPEFEWVAY